MLCERHLLIPPQCLTSPLPKPKKVSLFNNISNILNFHDILVIPHNNFNVDNLDIPDFLDIPFTHHDIADVLEKLKLPSS